MQGTQSYFYHRRVDLYHVFFMIQKSQKNLTFNSRSVVPLANLTPSPRFLLRERNLENANSRNSVTLINIEHLLHLKATAAPRIVGNILHFPLQIFFCLLFAAIFLSKFRRKLISLLQLQYFVANK